MIAKHLENGARGRAPETPKPGDPLFARVEKMLQKHVHLQLWVRVTPEDLARLTRTATPPQSLSIRQACQRWHLTVAQLWTGVKTGQYIGYRIRPNQRWEFRVTMP